ncbi:MAG: capsule assembly Wzi family protein [Melioribacteraceae bacterium]|nr:capsule assembly Wzi family protein [Melioribacteraceae bacterium]
MFNKQKSFFHFLLFAFVLLTPHFSLLTAQVVNQPLHSDIYQYLSRLSQRGVIELHDEIRPLSRKYIASKLIEISDKRHEITDLELDELEFYSKDFGREISKEVKRQISNVKKGESNEPVRYSDSKHESHISHLTSHVSFGYDSYNRIRLFSYEDSLFAINLSPILGYSYGKNDGEKQTHLWNGFSIYGYLTDYIGFSFDFRDNAESGNNIDRKKEFTPITGITDTKPTSTSVEYSEFRAMIGTDWSWGSFSIGKDFINWGYGEGGLLTLSSKAPSFPYFRLDLYPTDWISFNYFHAWLESDVIDSTGIYPSSRDGYNRIQYRSKYLASHTLTFRPFSGLSFSLGESVVYSDKLEFLYLFPLSFFRAADHYYSNQRNDAGANSQFFFSLSSRNHIPNTHLFATLLIDEIALSDIGDPERERSQFGFVFGGSVTDLPINNLTFAINYTRINPFVYRHYIPTQTYESRSYVMGHWMQHNADQIYLSLNYRIIRGLQVKTWIEFIRKGEDGVVDDQYTRPSKPFLFGLRKNYTNWGFNAKYEIIHEAFVSLDFKSFFTTEEDENGIFTDTRRNEFFMSLNYGF